MSNNTSTRFHPLQVTLHWLIVLLVFAAFIIGKSMSRLPNDDTAKIAPLAIHMSVGILTLVVMVIRVITRMKLSTPAYASTGNIFLDKFGKTVHGLLYIVVMLIAISGMSLSLQAGLAPIVFGRSGASLPADFYDFTARMLHGFAAPALVLLVLLHISGAFYHQLILRDNLLSRMWYKK